MQVRGFYRAESNNSAYTDFRELIVIFILWLFFITCPQIYIINT